MPCIVASAFSFCMSLATMQHKSNINWLLVFMVGTNICISRSKDREEVDDVDRMKAIGLRDQYVPLVYRECFFYYYLKVASFIFYYDKK